MRLLKLFSIAIAALGVVSCGLSGEQQTDLTSVRHANVPAPLYNKMVRGEDLSIGDAITLSRAGVGDDVIVRYIREQHTIYRLTPHDFATLRDGGVSRSVIDYMDHTDYRSPDSPWGP